MEKTRSEAFALLSQYTQSESLIKHALAVEAAMLWYARHFGVTDPSEREKWGITGLLHDFDYEKFPQPDPEKREGHPFSGEKVLAEQGFAQDVRLCILSHATFSGVPRDTLMAKTLFAVDELSGLVVASVYVRPDRSLLTIEAKSVLKKMKDKSFAAGCNRDEIREGAEKLGIELSQHISNTILALRTVANELGLC